MKWVGFVSITSIERLRSGLRRVILRRLPDIASEVGRKMLANDTPVRGAAIETKRLDQIGVLYPRKNGQDAIGLAKLIRLGQSEDDTFFVRQSKAILVSFLMFFSTFATFALMDPGRPPFVHLMDVAVILGSLGVMFVLWRTKNLSFAFSVVCSVGLALLFVFFLLVGNRGADLMMPLIFPLLSVCP